MSLTKKKSFDAPICAHKSEKNTLSDAVDFRILNSSKKIHRCLYTCLELMTLGSRRSELIYFSFIVDCTC